MDYLLFYSCCMNVQAYSTVRQYTVMSHFGVVTENNSTAPVRVCYFISEPFQHDNGTDQRGDGPRHIKVEKAELHLCH